MALAVVAVFPSAQSLVASAKNQPLLPLVPVSESRRDGLADTSQVKALIGQPGVKVIDARGRLFFRKGHIPGALNLARQQFETDFAAHEGVLRAKGVETLVVYCSDVSCDDSRVVADELQKRGFPRVLVFAGGWEAWQREGGATESE